MHLRDGRISTMSSGAWLVHADKTLCPDLLNDGALFTRCLHALHELGLHHGDLEPRNVCVDLDGYVRLIDLGSAEECFCRKHQWRTECSEMATLRDDSQREICFETSIHLERS